MKRILTQQEKEELQELLETTQKVVEELDWPDIRSGPGEDWQKITVCLLLMQHQNIRKMGSLLMAKDRENYETHIDWHKKYMKNFRRLINVLRARRKRLNDT